MKLSLKIIAILVFNFFELNLNAQVTASDCPDAINACTNPNFIISPSGSGLDEEFTVGSISNPSVNPASSNSGCLLSGELNSTWIIITVVTTGTLEFSMGDGSSPGCMDWIMWPYNSSTCNDISSNVLPPIRCNWNGACLGFTGCANTVPAGADPSDFEPAINANAGDQFIVCFSNYSAQMNLNVPMDFFGTAQVSCYTTVFICPGESIQLSAFAGAAGSTYNWTPTTGIIGSSTSQTITVSPGNTTVYECTTTQPNTVILDTSIQVSINTPPVLTASITLESCQGANDGSFSVTPSGVGPFTFTIDGLAATSGNFTNMGDGSYLIEVTDNNGCVSDTLITLAPGPICCNMTVSSTNTAASCIGSCDGTATANFINNNGTPTFIWRDELGNPIGQNTQTATGLCAGDYSVDITDPGLCTFTSLVTITEGMSLNIQSITITDPLCFNDCNAEITINSMSATNFSIDNGVTFSTNNSFLNLCPGEYEIFVSNAIGCVGDSIITINNPIEVIADFYATPEITTIENPLVNFVNLSQGNSQNLWDFSGLGTSTLIHPSFTFPSESPDTYSVCLMISDDNGCSDTICDSVIINDGLFYFVPNSFTPNGDGKNDEFRPILNNFDAENYELLIFNRWGEIIFQTEDINAGWDGSGKNGPVNDRVMNDVYVWKITGADRDTGIFIELFGHVTVFK
jgi:gliding motility-associated-like protein